MDAVIPGVAWQALSRVPIWSLSRWSSFAFLTASLHTDNGFTVLNSYLFNFPSLLCFYFGFEQTQKLIVKPSRSLVLSASPVFKGGELFLCFQDSTLGKLPALTSCFILHSNFLQTRPPPPPSDLNKLKFGLLKAKTFVPVLTFRVLSRIPNSTILWSLQPRLSLTDILQNLSWFVSSNSSSWLAHLTFVWRNSPLCIPGTW